jgi:hypothetical protein
VRRIQPTFVLVGRAEECEFQEGPRGRVHDGVCRPEGMWRKVVVLPDFFGSRRVDERAFGPDVVSVSGI